MDAEKGRQDQMDYRKDEKAACGFIKSKKEDKSREMADAVSSCESISPKPANPPTNISPASEDTQHFPNPSLSYIALIAKVILSSPSQKLNLASIYRAMEEKFPYLKSRGPGWRNSVRHNLSVNTCFVKVSRCEDGRGHYWGIHHAHLRDFQQGNFRQYRKARGRRDMERYDRAARCLMETSCLLGKFCDSGSLRCMEPQCPLQEPMRYQRSLLDWTKAHFNPWGVNMSWGDSSSWVRHHWFPERDSYGGAVIERGHTSSPLTSRLHSWGKNDPRLTGTRESCDSSFMTLPLPLLSFPGCWCVAPVMPEIPKPLPYKVSYKPI